MGLLLAGRGHPSDQAALGVRPRFAPSARTLPFLYPIAGRRWSGLPDRGRDDHPGWRRGIWDPAVPGLLWVSLPPDARLSMVGTGQAFLGLQPLRPANYSVSAGRLRLQHAPGDHLQTRSAYPAW